MALELLQQCTFTGPALPEPFVQFELEKELSKEKLLSKTMGQEGKELQVSWESYRRKLRELAVRGGALRVQNHVIEPLVERLGYARLESAPKVETREGQEDGGYLFLTADNQSKLRVWCTEFETDLDAPVRRGAAYRYSHLRIAQRVLLTCGERLGLLTNGVELRLLISDPARPDSQVTITIDPYWKRSRNIPDSYLLLLALASPEGVKKLPNLVEKARLQQARVTKELRVQARQAVERFIHEILEHPDNREMLKDLTPQPHREQGSGERLAKQLWKEGLIVVYRLLFVLKLEASDDPARAFSFASTSLWRNTFSPTITLAEYARKVLDEGMETGSFLESGLRSLFRMFAEGISCTELNVKPLGGALFGAGATPVLSKLQWGERAVAHLLDQLLWTAPKRGASNRQRVHYGSLDVEDLGRVYEALLELEPGISTERMCRLRRQKLEVVVPVVQGEKYRPAVPQAIDPVALEEELEEAEEDEEDEAPKKGKKTKVEWIEEIPPNRFYLRVGLGRKASGSYYTPHSFVRFLVQETLGPQVEERSPKDDPNPMAILKLKVLDPAMGSGHFLVEACRFLGDKLYEACRLCDELATKAEGRVEKAKTPEEKDAALAEAQKFWQRVIDLPDPDDKLMKYLPSSAPERKESGFSQQEAIALCRRLVAVHCLYGVDKNPLAVELAKLSLWLESHAEGLPLTFLDHRLVLGDSLTGAFFEHLLKEPASGDDVQKLVWQNVNDQFRHALADALRYVRDLEASIGTDISDIEAKEIAKQNLDRALAPFKILAAAWSGGVMLGDESGDTDYASLFSTIAQTGDLPEDLSDKPKLLAMIAKGLGAEAVPGERSGLLEVLASKKYVPAFTYDLTFAEVFYPDGNLTNRQGFDAVLGNPPWEKLRVERRDVVAAIDPRFLSGKEVAGIGDEHELIKYIFESNSEAKVYELEINQTRSFTQRTIIEPATSRGYDFPIGNLDTYHLFIAKFQKTLSMSGGLGLVLGGGFAKSPTESGLRRLIFEQIQVRIFAHFFNLNQLFVGASSRISFVLIVADHNPRLQQILTGFDLKEFTDLPLKNIEGKLVPLNRKRLIGEFSSNDNSVNDDTTSHFNVNGINAKKILSNWRISVSEGLHRTENKKYIESLEDVLPGCTDARLPQVQNELIARNVLCLYAGRSIDLFNPLPEEKSGKWTPQIDLVVSLRCSKLLSQINNLSFYRLAWRETCGHIATNQRSARACILPPATAASNSLIVETSSRERPTNKVLAACSIINSFSFDFQVRRLVQTHFNKGILSKTVFPKEIQLADFVFLSHSALRLNCVHHGYEPLWREQLGDEWREPNKDPFTFPVLATEDDRWSVRAAIDGIVAQAYGLERDQYAHVLSTFSHKSYPKAPQLCLDRFDELEAIGLEAFTKKYDPYWDIPLNENLPQPVIDLPIPESLTPEYQQGSLDLASVTEKPKRQRRKKNVTS
ncbi:hypothetical protein H6F96_10205 [Microcoleus sp. FACHB-53]|nr:hypothetical protein [Microcoleus sp. FACHB-53]